MSTTLEAVPQTRPKQLALRLPCPQQGREILDRLGLSGPRPEVPNRVLGITSCTSGEGVTTVAAQLATAAAELRYHTALVDCQIWRPGLHRMFDVNPSPGLKEALEDVGELPHILRPSGVENLTLLTTGAAPGSATFRSARLSQLFDELRQEFELVIVDLPSVSDGHAVGIGSLMDGVLLVVESEGVRWEVAQNATSSLQTAGVNLLGAVMNKRPEYLPRWLYRSL